MNEEENAVLTAQHPIYIMWDYVHMFSLTETVDTIPKWKRNHYARRYFSDRECINYIDVIS